MPLITNQPTQVNNVNTTTVPDVTPGVIIVLSLGNKLDYVIDHITDNRLDIVGITETWPSHDEKPTYQWLHSTIAYLYIRPGSLAAGVV